MHCMWGRKHGLQRYAAQLGVVMKGIQLQAYDEVLDSYRARRASAEDMRGTALAALTQLRSISLHPRLENESALYSEDGKQARQLMMESGKLAVLLQLLDKIRSDEIRSKGDKVILFMMTKRLQRVLKLWLDQIYDLNVAVINGDTQAVATRAEDMTRKKLSAEFEAKSGFNILIMSPVCEFRAPCVRLLVVTKLTWHFRERVSCTARGACRDTNLESWWS